jgi:hypothetical protein
MCFKNGPWFFSRSSPSNVEFGAIFWKNQKFFWPKYTTPASVFAEHQRTPECNLGAGWPDWAKFRVLCDCLLWVVSFFNAEVGQIVRATFSHGKIYALIAIRLGWATFWASFSHTHQGSMLWSQFSAIFDNFRQKKLAFFSKTNVMITIFAKN